MDYPPNHHNTLKFPLIESLDITSNQSLSPGIFQEKLKVAKVIPIFKKDDSSLIEFFLKLYVTN